MSDGNAVGLHKLQPIFFKYRNHRGEVSDRHIIPDSFEFMLDPPDDFYPQPGWFISGFDLDKQARRTFCFANIVTRVNLKLLLRD